MFEYRTLEGVDTEILHKAFVEAFSDYQVKLDLPLWKLQRMLKRRGYVPEKSLGALKDEELVGFILNGCRKWKGRYTAYDIGTGVLPDYRKQGLTTNMFRKASELLRAEGVEQYLLEVIQENTAAYELYKKQGFKVERTFTCYKLDNNKCKIEGNIEVSHADGLETAEWEQVKAFWDAEPSWQNSIEAVRPLPGGFLYSTVRSGNKIVGYGIMEKRTGDIPQFGVDRDHRGQGIGRRIIADLISNSETGKAAVLNVDDRSKSIKDFLSSTGFEPYVLQYEMIFDMNA
ncbi:MAG TPA: GNAT family N-acetyltransferase [Clostridia bacterium]|nr:GNAT family N-acetyltransferase [Clostridia bacterium]